MRRSLTTTTLLMIAGAIVICENLVSQGIPQTSGPSVQTVHAETTVTPLPNEDIASDCHYVLTIPEPQQLIRGVWVIFDRGHDIHDLYSDVDVLAFASRFNLALLLHSHCPGKNPSDHEDMNMDPTKGLGPALVRSLNQLAQTTGHPELSKAGLILLGFSGAGPLSARIIGAYPDRVIAGILSSPGHFKPDGIDTVELSIQAQAVPELIIAGGADNVSGTELPYLYFEKYRRLGAPWSFTVENRSPHCCTANAKTLILKWLEAVMGQRQPRSAGNPLTSIRQDDGWLTFIEPQRTDINDSFGLKTFNVSEARIQAVKRTKPSERLAAGWLPDHAVAQEWLSFTQQEKHPILPLH
jgi:pimeloyl-ACP methyl ester carboxylesterase